MKTIELQCLNQTQTLAEIGRELLVNFFARFGDELAALDLYLPNPAADPDSYYASLASLLGALHTLPGGLQQALFAIEQMASPEMQPRRQTLLAEAPPELGLDPAASPHRQALQLWQHCPYPLMDQDTPPSTPDAERSTPNSLPRQSTSTAGQHPTLTPPPSSGLPVAPYRRGKVARLPKPVRDQLDQMMEDGVP